MQISLGGKLWELNQVQKELLKRRENQISVNEIIKKLREYAITEATSTQERGLVTITINNLIIGESKELCLSDRVFLF